MDETTQTAVRAVVQDAIDSGKLADQLLVKLRSGDKAGAVAQLPAVVAQVKTDIAAVQAVLPAVKDGYRTSEFWVAAAVIGAVVVFQYTGHPLPFDETAVMGAVAAVYALVRGSVKKAA